jgi:transposase
LAAIESIAPKIGCVLQTLQKWVRRLEIDGGLRDGITSEERDRTKALKCENKVLRRANEILKLASAFFALAELDRRLKSSMTLLTSIATPTGSSRSARYCRSPHQGIGAMLRANASPNCVVHAPRRMTRSCRKSSKSGSPICRATAPTRFGII